MKKSVRILWSLINLISALVVLGYVFSSEIGTIYWSLKCKSPVEIGNLKIAFPRGVVYKIGKGGIFFYHWEEGPKSFLVMDTMEPTQMSNDARINFLKGKRFHVIETNDVPYRGYPAFTISYIDDEWIHNKEIFVVPKNLYIKYQGSLPDFKDYKKIIDNVEFLGGTVGQGR